MKERGINKRELRSDLWTAGRKESLTRVYVLLYDGDNVCCLVIMFICNARLDKVFFFFFFFSFATTIGYEVEVPIYFDKDFVFLKDWRWRTGAILCQNFFEGESCARNVSVQRQTNTFYWCSKVFFIIDVECHVQLISTVWSYKI